MTAAERLNADGHAGNLSLAALQHAMRAQGDAWQNLVAERCPHLFADVAVFITSAQLRQMRDVIEAVERVAALPGWRKSSLPSPAGGITSDLAGVFWLPSRMASSSIRGAGGEGEENATKGVFFGYDFHLNADGAHLIEINTNAGGGFLNALLLDSQRDTGLPGKAIAVEDVEQAFLEMFRNEWRLERGDAPLKTIAIVDDQPEEQYLYPEFLLARSVFERAGITTHIVAPDMLHVGHDGLYLVSEKIDLVYNRLTDFDLQRYPQLRSAYEKRQAVITPNPANYHRYADKRKLAWLTDGAGMRAEGLLQASIDVLLQGVPQTRIVRAADAEQWWAERKQWFFKPVSGYGGKGAYRGEKLTRRVFDEIMQGDYVAQKMAAPGERVICAKEGVEQLLKYDVRCYVYDGQIQLVAARLYQGQTTNFRTPGGGFAAVHVVE